MVKEYLHDLHDVAVKVVQRRLVANLQGTGVEANHRVVHLLDLIGSLDVLDVVKYPDKLLKEVAIHEGRENVSVTELQDS